jgi:hypothetical protein
MLASEALMKLMRILVGERNSATVPGFANAHTNVQPAQEFLRHSAQVCQRAKMQHASPYFFSWIAPR